VPAALPHILAAARNSLGLAWKVVVSGEVLSQPAFAIGTGMQAARQNLETVEVFAWVAAVIVLCAISDFIFTMVARILPWNSA
jgi:NitT/TauT family transport system permease protein